MAGCEKIYLTTDQINDYEQWLKTTPRKTKKYLKQSAYEITNGLCIRYTSRKTLAKRIYKSNNASLKEQLGPAESLMEAIHNWITGGSEAKDEYSDYELARRGIHYNSIRKRYMFGHRPMRKTKEKLVRFIESRIKWYTWYHFGNWAN